MQKLTLVLVLAALGVGGWQAFEASRLRDDLARQGETTADLSAMVAGLTRDVARLEGREPAPDMIAWDADGAGGSSDASTAGDGQRLAGRGTSPQVLAREVQDLREEMETLKAENETLREDVASRPAVNWKRPTLIRDVDQAEEVLDLTSTQKADIERTVEWTKRELEDLFAIPNEDGKLYSDIQKQKISTGGNESGGMVISMPNFGEIQKFRNAKVPGRDETYAEAEQRIRDRGKQEVRDTLTPEQQETWDGAVTDPLLGPSHGGMFSTVSVFAGGEAK